MTCADPGAGYLRHGLLCGSCQFGGSPSRCGVVSTVRRRFAPTPPTPRARPASRTGSETDSLPTSSGSGSSSAPTLISGSARRRSDGFPAVGAATARFRPDPSWSARVRHPRPESADCCRRTARAARPRLLPRVLPPHQAACDRAAARHHAAGDDPGRRRASRRSASIVAVLVGGALAAGGANTINCWIERDRDQLMRRTTHRPLPAGDIEPTGALVFGLVLEVAAFALLWATANLLAAVARGRARPSSTCSCTRSGSSPGATQNIVIGGAAGAVPVLVGWAAVTGELAAPAWVLFAIVFFWTPPHFWALSLRYRDDYAAAGIPMLPGGPRARRRGRQILAYSVVVTAVSRAPARVDAQVGADLRRRRRCSALAFIWSAGDPPARRPDTRAGHAPVHVLEHVPRAPVRRRCRRHPHPLRLTRPAHAAPPSGTLVLGRGRWSSPCIAVSVVADDAGATTTTRATARTTVERDGSRHAPRDARARRSRCPTLDGGCCRLADARGHAARRQLLGVVVHPVPQGVPAPRRRRDRQSGRRARDRRDHVPRHPVRRAAASPSEQRRRLAARLRRRPARRPAPTACARSRRRSSSTATGTISARIYGALGNAVRAQAPQDRTSSLADVSDRPEVLTPPSGSSGCREQRRADGPREEHARSSPTGSAGRRARPARSRPAPPQAAPGRRVSSASGQPVAAGTPSRRGTAARGTARSATARFASARSVPAMSMPMPGERDRPDEQQRRSRARGLRSGPSPSATPGRDDHGPPAATSIDEHVRASSPRAARQRDSGVDPRRFSTP